MESATYLKIQVFLGGFEFDEGFRSAPKLNDFCHVLMIFFQVEDTKGPFHQSMRKEK